MLGILGMSWLLWLILVAIGAPFLVVAGLVGHWEGSSGKRYGE